MNEEAPSDIKCPQCANRFPFSGDTDPEEHVSCPQCGTVIEDILSSIEPSSLPIEELPARKNKGLNIDLPNLIRNNLDTKSPASEIQKFSEGELPPKQNKDINIDLPDFIKSGLDAKSQTSEGQTKTQNFTKFAKISDQEFDHEFVKKQEQLAQEFAISQSQIVTWDEGKKGLASEEGKVQSRYRLKSVLFSLGFIVLIIALTVRGVSKNFVNKGEKFTFNFSEEDTTQNEENKDPATIGKLLISAGAKALHKEATTALLNFLKAENIESRIKFCRHPHRVRPLMESYYLNRNPGPIAYRKFSEVGDDETGVIQGFYLLKLSFDDFSILPVVIAMENEQLVVDWESFVGYSEMSLTEFVNKKPKEPTLLRLHARTDDYFNFQFTEKDYRCLYLRDSEDQESVYGYLLKGSPADDKLSTIVESGESISFVVIRLRYPDILGGKNQTLIEEIVSSGWLIIAKDN